MYVLIKDNFLVMNLYLEYMYGFIDIENWWIIIIDILYCCVLFYVGDFLLCFCYYLCFDLWDSKIIYICMRSGIVIVVLCFYDFL